MTQCPVFVVVTFRRSSLTDFYGLPAFTNGAETVPMAE